MSYYFQETFNSYDLPGSIFFALNYIPHSIDRRQPWVLQAISVVSIKVRSKLKVQKTFMKCNRNIAQIIKWKGADVSEYGAM